MPPAPQPLFLKVDDTPYGARLAIHHPPVSGTPRGLVVHVHPFAEEMNKARRMTATQSRALADAGYAVLQIDLLGCGDSAGDFGDATWSYWVDDVIAAVRWLQDRHSPEGGTPPAPLWLWGLRAGTLLATDAATQLAQEGTRCHFLFWQPVPVGNLLLQQFLRLKAAGEMLTGQAKAAVEEMRAQIAAGQSVEIAGYKLASETCQGLEQARLRPPAGMVAGQVVWLEVSPVEIPALAPAGGATLAAWRDAGWAVQAQAVRGPAFWHTTEIEDAPELITSTLAALQVATEATLARPEASAA